MANAPTAPAGHIEEEGLLVTDDTGGDGWEVWCGADGADIINAHLIGCGKTRGDAIARAIKETRELLARLEAIHG